MSLANKWLSPGVLALILTTLSVAVSMAEGRQCYWCGPLADQVHRSRRAPSCAGADRRPITVCEPGYLYCAVAATSPPYVESRYCVKVYQDECYTQFCNTTKTWKMTCSCRGDLCNGDNGDRETDAFEVLPKLVNKTHSRIKKRAPNNKLKNIQNKVVNPKDGNESVDNSLEHQLSDKPDTKSDTGPPIVRSLKKIPENDTLNAPNVPSSASSDLTAQPEQNAPTIPDTPTTMIEIQFKRTHPTDSIHKINDVVSHEIEISPEPAIQQNDQAVNTKDEKDATLYKNESDLGEDSRNSNTSLEVSATPETSGTLTTVLVSSTGDSSKKETSAAQPEMPVQNVGESPTEHIPSVPSILPGSTATDSTPLTTLVKDMTATLVDQAPPKIDAKSPTDSITKQAKTPTAEAFLQDTSATDKSDKEKTQTEAVTTHSPPPAETVHTTTDNPVTQSTTTVTAANVSESSNKRKKNRTKNAAATIQASDRTFVYGTIIGLFYFIISRFMQ